MIQASELRCGNILYDKVGDHCKIITVSSKTIVQIDNGAKSFKPVPLTPEIAEKCGFEMTGSEGCIYSLFLSKSDEGEYSRQRIDIFWAVDGKAELSRGGVCFKRIPCNSIHQLQNLYYSLTGEELTISL